MDGSTRRRRSRRIRSLRGFVRGENHGTHDHGHLLTRTEQNFSLRLDLYPHLAFMFYRRPLYDLQVITSCAVTIMTRPRQQSLDQQATTSPDQTKPNAMHRNKHQQQRPAEWSWTAISSETPHELGRPSTVSKCLRRPTAFSARMPLKTLDNPPSQDRGGAKASSTVKIPIKKDSSSSQPSAARALTAKITGLFSTNPKECSCCSEEHPASDYPKLKGCKHKADICRNCLAQWLSSQLETNTGDRMKCPSLRCETRIARDTVRKYASADVFDRSVAILSLKSKC